MLILGIDTCCAPASAAVYDSGVISGEITLNCGRTHSQKIMPMVELLLSSLGIKTGDIDCFAAAAGPGSFTGVRIGTASVKAMAHACGKPCAAVSTLEALAHNVRYFDGIICPILDARRSQVYTALFEGGSCARLCADTARPVDGLLQELKGKRVIFLGDGVLVHRDRISEALGSNAVFADADKLLNSAASVAAVAAEMLCRGETVSYSDLTPDYIRLSQAEREKMERESK